MITLFDAIRTINPSIVTLRDENAFDANETPVVYDMVAAQAKLLELQEAELKAWQDKDMAKQSAITKLSKLGLTDDEIKAITGQA
jgi:hypothetical protein